MPVEINTKEVNSIIKNVNKLNNKIEYQEKIIVGLSVFIFGLIISYFIYRKTSEAHSA